MRVPPVLHVGPSRTERALCSQMTTRRQFAYPGHPSCTRSGTMSKLPSWSTVVLGATGIVACQLFIIRVFRVHRRPHDTSIDLRPYDKMVDPRPHEVNAKCEDGVNSKVEVAPPEHALSGLRVTTGGLLFWGGTVSVGLSTAVLLAVNSRHLHHQGFASLSTLIGL